jgi:hypothetical protein
MYAQPNINYGTNTYAANNKPIDTSKYFITGDRGVYNLLPALGAINSPSSNRVRLDRGEGRDVDRLFGANVYTPYEAYNDIRTQMANDPTALAAFNTAFTPSAYNVSAKDRGSRVNSGFFGRFFNNRMRTPGPFTTFNTENPFPYQYVDYGLSRHAVPATEGYRPLSYNSLARYANKNDNPFFMPFETTQDATVTGFTPSAQYLAADTANPYYTNYQNLLSSRRAERDDDDRRPVTPAPVAPAPVMPNPVTPAPVMPNPVTPAPVMPNPVTPAPVTPTPVAPAPVTPTPVMPPAPGNFVPMARGGLASLRRR